MTTDPAAPSRRRGRSPRNRPVEDEPATSTVEAAGISAAEPTVPEELAAEGGAPAQPELPPPAIFSSPMTRRRPPAQDDAPVAVEEPLVPQAVAAEPEFEATATAAAEHGPTATAAESEPAPSRRTAARGRRRTTTAASAPAEDAAPAPAETPPLIDEPEAAAAQLAAAPPETQKRPRRRRAAATPTEAQVEPASAPERSAAANEALVAHGDEPLSEALVADWAVAPPNEAEEAEIARLTREDAAVYTTAFPTVTSFDEDEAVTWTPALVEAEVAEPPEVTESEEDESTATIAVEGPELFETGGRRRRRRGRGRRGGRRVNGHAEETAPPEAADVAPAVSEPPAPEARQAESRSAPDRVRQEPAQRQPVFPDYPVEFEPLPPPTKRRPARRPGMTSEPRFSAEELREFESFVGGRRGTRQATQPAPTGDELRASLLTPEEERELSQALPQRRPRRGREAGAPQAVATPAEPALAETPAFAPMPAAPTRADAGSIEALLARQNVIIDTLMERQIALLRNIERAMIALDRRFGSSTQGITNLPRAAAFVDVPNVIYAAERIGCTIDFTKLLNYLMRGRELVRASAYAPVSDDPQMRLETQKFVQPFVNRGFRIVTKPLKRFADGTMKGNFDVELAMDILTMADRLDIVCLVSGDGDFSRLVEIVASKGVRVEVIAFSSSTSSELRAIADEYIDLALHLREICAS